MGRLKNQDGFTVVELLTAILIGGMMLAVISSFLTTHSISFELNTDIVTIQQDGQSALNKIVDIAIESKGLKKIDVDNEGHIQEIDLSNETDILNVQCFVLELYDTVEGTNDYHQFRLDDKTLKYSKSSTSDFSDSPNEVELSRHIANITLRAGDTNFADCHSLIIELDLENGDATLDVSNQVTFRNKP